MLTFYLVPQAADGSGTWALPRIVPSASEGAGNGIDRIRILPKAPGTAVAHLMPPHGASLNSGSVAICVLNPSWISSAPVWHGRDGRCL
jgi:hypothetical protein